MIAFAVREAEKPLLEDRVFAVPQRQGEAQPLMVVAETGEAVFAPMISSRAGLVMGEIVPRIASLAVILSHGAPLAFTEIGAPLFPRHALLTRLVKTYLLRRSCAL
jgi:hypothetical protein